MQNLTLDEQFPNSAEEVWSVVGVLDRVDWVPGIDSAELIGDERHMTMNGLWSKKSTATIHSRCKLNTAS